MTKSKSLASYVTVPSIFVIHLINGPELINPTNVAVKSPFFKM